MKRYYVGNEGLVAHRTGTWVSLADYQCLQAALREALNEWHKMARHWIHQYAGEMCDEKLVEKSMLEVQDAGGTLMRIALDNARITELRAQFLDDKEPS